MITIYEVKEIREKRKELNLTQEKMAGILKIGITTYKRYEKGLDMPVSKAKKCTEYFKKLEALEKAIVED